MIKIERNLVTKSRFEDAHAAFMYIVVSFEIINSIKFTDLFFA